jgi:hypothetical protein
MDIHSALGASAGVYIGAATAEERLPSPMSSGTTRYAPQSNRVKLVVASSVMLTFISFWRAAAVVLNDLGSSAF